MFAHIKAKVKSVEPLGRNLFSNTGSLLSALPTTLYEIKKISNVRFLLSNSFLINGIQFLSPFIAYSVMKLLLQTQIKSSYPEYSENEYVTFTANALDNTVYAILFTRIKVKNIVFNIISNLGGTRVLHEEFSDDELHSLCLQCEKESNRLVKEASLIVHYGIGGLGITIAETVISYIPYAGPPASFMLDAYWRGFGIYQYPLTRENICAKHKIAILMQDRMRLILFGLFYALIELAIMYQLKDRVSDVISERVLLASVSNFLMLFALIHVHNIPIHIPKNNSELPESIPFDPITATWSLSLKTTEKSSQFILSFAKQNKNKNTEEFLKLLNRIEQLNELWKILSNQPAFYMLITFIIDLIASSELKSFKEFSRASALRPFMISFLEDADALLTTVNHINEHPVTQVVYYSLKIPFVGRRLTNWGASYAKTQMGVEPAFTKALILLIQFFQISENLGDIKSKVEEVHKKSLESHNRNTWHKLLGFGSNTPRTWFIYNRDFVKVKKHVEVTKTKSTAGLLLKLNASTRRPSAVLIEEETQQTMLSYQTKPVVSPIVTSPKEDDFCFVNPPSGLRPPSPC